MKSVFTGLSEAEELRLRQIAKDELNTNQLYNPLQCANFWEAINEASDAQLNKAHALLSSGDFVAAAAAMNLIAYDYWFEHVCALNYYVAVDQLAQEEFDRSNRRSFAMH